MRSWPSGKRSRPTSSHLPRLRTQIAAKIGKQRRAKPPPSPSDMVETYRYLSSRLRHRVLNVLPRTSLSIDILGDEIRNIGNEELITRLSPALDDLKASLRRLEEAVNFDADQTHFVPTHIHLPFWLRENSIRFQAQFGTTGFQFDFDNEDKAVIIASPYHLGLVFTNIWANSVQATQGSCTISVRVRIQGMKVHVLTLDNGPGLDANDEERAFSYQYSTKDGENRGLGLLEVAEAMRRLRGEAAVQQVPKEGYRIMLKFVRSS